MAETFKPFDGSDAIAKKNKRRDTLNLKLSGEDTRQKNQEKINSQQFDTETTEHGLRTPAERDVYIKATMANDKKAESESNLTPAEKNQREINSQVISNKDVKLKDEPRKVITPEDVQKKMDSKILQSDIETVKHGYRTPAERDAYIERNKSDVKETPSGFDLSTPEGRQDYLRTQESDKGKAERREKELEIEKEEEEKLFLEVERTRMIYAKKEYESTNSIAKIKKVLGKFVKIDSNNIQDVKGCYDDYKKKLNDLLVFRTSKLKEKDDLSKDELGQEIDRLIKFYTVDEDEELIETHTNIRGEAWENKFGKKPGEFLKKGKKYIDIYRKYNWKKKLVIGGALTAAGFAIGATGGVVAGGVAIGARRFFGGAVAGVGATSALEARYEKKKQEEQKKRSEYIKGSMELHEDEYKFDVLMDHLQREVAGYDKKLKNEKIKARERKLFGALVATFIGSGAAASFFSWGAEKIGNTETIQIATNFWSEKISGIMEKTGLADIGKAYASDYQGTLDNSMEKTSSVPRETNFKIVPEEVGEKIDLTVSKGGSFTGSIAKYLETNSGMDPAKAKVAAFKMYTEYMEHCPDPMRRDYNVIQPGSKIEIGFNAKGELKILSFEDGKKLAISDVGAERSVSSGKNIEPSKDIKTSGSSGMVTDESKGSQGNNFYGKEPIVPEEIPTDSTESPIEKVSDKTPTQTAKFGNEVGTGAISEISVEPVKPEDVSSGSNNIEKNSGEFSPENQSSPENTSSSKVEKIIASEAPAQSTKIQDTLSPKATKTPIKAVGVPPENIPVAEEIPNQTQIEKPVTNDTAGINETISADKLELHKQSMSRLEGLKKELSIRPESEQWEKTTNPNVNRPIATNLKFERESNLARIDGILSDPDKIRFSFNPDGKTISYKSSYFDKSLGERMYCKVSINSSGEYSTRDISEIEYNKAIPLKEIDSIKPVGAVEASQEVPSSQSPEIVKEISKKYGFVENSTPLDRTSDISYQISSTGKEMSLGERSKNWETIKKLKFSDLGKEKKLPEGLAENIKKVEKELVSILGDEAKQNPDKTVISWVTKVARLPLLK